MIASYSRHTAPLLYYPCKAASVMFCRLLLIFVSRNVPRSLLPRCLPFYRLSSSYSYAPFSPASQASFGAFLNVKAHKTAAASISNV